MDYRNIPFLSDTIQECCKDFNVAFKEGVPFIVNPSVPILWFGDFLRYMDSSTKIVTVGINPSNNEFLKKADVPTIQLDYRLKGATSWIGKENGLNDSELKAYFEAMNSYFRYNPFRSWFGWNESALNGLDASYYEGKAHNRAIHIDFQAPVATDPVWSPLETKCKKEGLDALDKLASFFNKYFYKMLETLSPDIVMIGIKESSFRSAFPLCKGKGMELLSNDKGGYIRLFDTALPFSGKKCLVVWNHVRNSPFAACGSQEEITKLFSFHRDKFDVFKNC